MVLRRGIPAYYLEGARIEAKLRRYKNAKEDVIESLKFLSFQISNIDGKLEEVNRCMYGDMRQQVTKIRISRILFFGENLVFNKKDTKRIETHVTWYNNCVKEERFGDASVALTDLKKILMELRQKEAVTFGIASQDIERKAHTPIVIKAKKRNG